METENRVIMEDLERIVTDGQIPWEMLCGKKIFVTGGTGLIGSTLIRALLYREKKYQDGPKILALIRNREKAQKVFGSWLRSENLTLIPGDVTETFPLGADPDYIVHGASQTSSRAFVQEPVETIRTALLGTENMLRNAVRKKTAGFVYLSSMEVYGTPVTDEKIDEEHGTNLNPVLVRNCYPESKRMCESMCCSYAEEYQVPAKILRMTQTFGPGVDPQDRRVFAEFARCVKEKKDIVLHTSGETRRNYLYTGDAVRAILYVLLKGENGQAYNAANEETYCSIYEMAVLAAEKIAEKNIQVKCEPTPDLKAFGYAPTLHMNLDTRKLQGLGWKPYYSLEECFRRMIECF